MNLTLNGPGMDIAMGAEGLRLKSYPDPHTGTSPWTIGRGHTGPGVHVGMTCTLEEANGWFLSDMAIADSVITRFVSVPLNANQRGALRSFIYNVGQGRASTVTSLGKDGFAVLANGKPSTMLLKLNAGDYQGCADEFLKWTMPGTNVHNGLLARRTAERSLFLKPEDNTGA